MLSRWSITQTGLTTLSCVVGGAHVSTNLQLLFHNFVSFSAIFKIDIRLCSVPRVCCRDRVAISSW